MRLFHGSTREFSEFDPYMVGTGAEPNSTLGVWLTRDAGSAVSYGRGRFLSVVEVDAPRLAVCSDDHVAIWGGEDLTSRDAASSRELFNKAREALMAKGFDGVLFDCPDTCMEGAVCIFDPSKAVISETVAYPEDRDVDELSCGISRDDCFVDHGESLEDALAEARAEEFGPAP